MLVLARKKQQSVVVGGASNVEKMLKVTVLEICGGTVRLGFEADKSVAVHRHEVWERIRAENEVTGDKVTLKTTEPMGQATE
jgi:carbon storage regulator